MNESSGHDEQVNRISARDADAIREVDTARIPEYPLDYDHEPYADPYDWEPAALHEWRCPNCGAITRAHMADQ